VIPEPLKINESTITRTVNLEPGNAFLFLKISKCNKILKHCKAGFQKMKVSGVGSRVLGKGDAKYSNET